MIAAPERDCFPETEIREFLAGKMTADRFESVLAHLDRCERCQEIAEGEVPSNDDWLHGLQKTASENDSVFNEPECLAALHHANALSRSVLSPSQLPLERLGVYRLIRPLGRGGMGTVYLAEHEKLKRRCAVKLLHSERRDDEAWRERFDREMHAVASLNHPNLVAATDAGEVDGWHFMVMEYLEGLDLATLSRHLGRLRGPLAAAIMARVCRGLGAMHEVGLIHRDVKPSNIMLTSDGEVKLLDLGLVAESDREDDLRLTTVGHIVGTLLFAAPEQLKNDGVVNKQSDLYSVGCTLYQLLSGRPPFDANQNIASLAIDKTTRKPDPIESELPVDESLAELVDQLLSLDSNDRPESAVSVVRRLDSLASGVSVKELRALARRGVRSLKDSNLEPAGARICPLTLTSQIALEPTGQVGEAGKPPGGRTRWLVSAAGFAGLVFAAIAFYLKTDNGVLVIESPRDDLTVHVRRGDQAVKTLEVDMGKSETTLRSGDYTVRIGEGGETLSLSEDSVTLRRGGEVVLKIIEREPAASLLAETSGAKSAEKLYKGKPLSHWLRILNLEHDVGTLGDTMSAIVALAGPDDVKTVHKILVLSRRLGGWVVGGDDSSGQFMDLLRDYKLARSIMPTPGLDAIEMELGHPDSNDKSRAASMMLLSQFSSSSQLRSWAVGNPTSGRRLYESLVALPKPREERFAKTQQGLRSGTLLTLGLSLNFDLSKVSGLREEIADRVADLKPKFPVDDRLRWWLDGPDFEKETPEMWTSGVTSATEVLASRQLKVEVPCSVAVRSLLFGYGNQFEPERKQQFIKLRSEKPVEVADELLHWLASSHARHETQMGAMAGAWGHNPAVEIRFEISLVSLVQAFAAHSTLLSEYLIHIATHTSRPDYAFRVFDLLMTSQAVESAPVTNPYNGQPIKISSQDLELIKQAMEVCRDRLDSLPPLPVAGDPPETLLPAEADPLYAVLSPDGSKVAFVGKVTKEKEKQYGLFVFDRRLQTLTRLIDQALKTTPAWSPDSKRIAIGNAAGYVSKYPLIIVDVETGQVEETGVQGVGAAWSPDGRSIAATSKIVRGGSWLRGVPADGQMTIYSIETNEAQYVGPESRNEALDDESEVEWIRRGGNRPVWSPSGARLAWVQCETKTKRDENNRRQESNLYQVWSVGRDGEDARLEIDNASFFKWVADGGDERLVKTKAAEK